MSQARARRRAATQRCSQRDVCPRCGNAYSGRIRLTRAQRRRRARALPNNDQHRGMRIVACGHPWHRVHAAGFRGRLVHGLDPYTRNVRGARR